MGRIKLMTSTAADAKRENIHLVTKVALVVLTACIILMVGKMIPDYHAAPVDKAPVLTPVPVDAVGIRTIGAVSTQAQRHYSPVFMKGTRDGAQADANVYLSQITKAAGMGRDDVYIDLDAGLDKLATEEGQRERAWYWQGYMTMFATKWPDLTVRFDGCDKDRCSLYMAGWQEALPKMYAQFN